eukprot:jgi/Bigna1/138335/aug1.44_g13043
MDLAQEHEDVTTLQNQHLSIKKRVTELQVERRRVAMDLEDEKFMGLRAISSGVTQLSRLQENFMQRIRDSGMLSLLEDTSDMTTPEAERAQREGLLDAEKRLAEIISGLRQREDRLLKSESVDVRSSVEEMISYLQNVPLGKDSVFEPGDQVTYRAASAGGDLEQRATVISGVDMLSSAAPVSGTIAYKIRLGQELTARPSELKLIARNENRKKLLDAALTRKPLISDHSGKSEDDNKDEEGFAKRDYTSDGTCPQITSRKDRRQGKGDLDTKMEQGISSLFLRDIGVLIDQADLANLRCERENFIDERDSQRGRLDDVLIGSYRHESHLFRLHGKAHKMHLVSPTTQKLTTMPYEVLTFGATVITDSLFGHLISDVGPPPNHSTLTPPLSPKHIQELQKPYIKGGNFTAHLRQLTMRDIESRFSEHDERRVVLRTIRQHCATENVYVDGKGVKHGILMRPPQLTVNQIEQWKRGVLGDQFQRERTWTSSVEIEFQIPLRHAKSLLRGSVAVPDNERPGSWQSVRFSIWRHEGDDAATGSKSSRTRVETKKKRRPGFMLWQSIPLSRGTKYVPFQVQLDRDLKLILRVESVFHIPMKSSRNGEEALGLLPPLPLAGVWRAPELVSNHIRVRFPVAIKAPASQALVLPTRVRVAGARHIRMKQIGGTMGHGAAVKVQQRRDGGWKGEFRSAEDPKTVSHGGDTLWVRGRTGGDHLALMLQVEADIYPYNTPLGIAPSLGRASPLQLWTLFWEKELHVAVGMLLSVFGGRRNSRFFLARGVGSTMLGALENQQTVRVALVEKLRVIVTGRHCGLAVLDEGRRWEMSHRVRERLIRITGRHLYRLTGRFWQTNDHVAEIVAEREQVREIGKAALSTVTTSGSTGTLTKARQDESRLVTLRRRLQERAARRQRAHGMKSSGVTHKSEVERVALEGAKREEALKQQVRILHKELQRTKRELYEERLRTGRLTVLSKQDSGTEEG